MWDSCQTFFNLSVPLACKIEVVVVLRSPIHANEPSEYNGMLYRSSNRVLNNGIKVNILICMDGTSQYHHYQFSGALVITGKSSILIWQLPNLFYKRWVNSNCIIIHIASLNLDAIHGFRVSQPEIRLYRNSIPHCSRKDGVTNQLELNQS